MSRFTNLLSTLSALLLLITLCAATSCPSDRTIPLNAIQTLTLDKNEYTASIRGKPPIPQIQCLGGRCDVLPQRVQCRNVGVDDTGNIQWDCQGDLPESFSFGKVEVSCIGCGQDRRGNDLVLKGSCGVMLEVVGDDGKGRRGPYRGGNSNENDYDSSYNTHTQYQAPTESSGKGSMGLLIVILILVFFCILCCRPKSGSGGATTSSHGGASGTGSSYSSGHDSIYPNAPPPPPGYGGSSSYDVDPPSFNRRKTYQQDTQSSSSGPGFMSGLGLGSVVGGVGGYMAGRRSAQNASQTEYQTRRPATFTRTRSPSPTYTRTRSPSPEKKKTAHGYGGTTLR